MFSSNVTQGRPVRLPLNDPNTRLFYHPGEWERYFPPYVMRALEKPLARTRQPRAAIRIARSLMASTPRRPSPVGQRPRVAERRHADCRRGAAEPEFSVAVRLVRVYAIDYETKKDEPPRLRRCLLSDGGLCSNFRSICSIRRILSGRRSGSSSTSGCVPTRTNRFGGRTSISKGGPTTGCVASRAPNTAGNNPAS